MNESEESELAALRTEVAKLRDIIIEGVMLTSDTVKAAKNRELMADSRAGQARIALRTCNTNRLSLRDAIRALLTDLDLYALDVPQEFIDSLRSALAINNYEGTTDATT